MDSFGRFNNEFKQRLRLIQRYLAVQYFDLFSETVIITFRVSEEHLCPKFIAQTDGSSCGLYVCLLGRIFFTGQNLISGDGQNMRNAVIADFELGFN